MSKSFLSKEHRPIVGVDAVIFTFDEVLKVLLWRRNKQPFKDELALCGGYVHVDEDENVDASMRRVLREKAGLEGVALEQLHTFSGQRDPRDWSITVAFFALCPPARLGKLSDRMELLPINGFGRLAFDHNEIVNMALSRLAQLSQVSTLPAAMLPKQFTLPELQAVYEAVLKKRLNPSSFRRKIAERRLLDAVDKPAETAAQGRPAQLWRLSKPMANFDRPL